MTTDPYADTHARPPVKRAVYCEQTGFGVLEVRGDDAISFMHGQLSSDVKALGPGSGQLWSYNSPKGRMLANGALWRPPAGDPALTMLLDADLAATIRKRLAMFVMRAKATLDDASDRYALIGVAGDEDAASNAVASAFGIEPGGLPALAAVVVDERSTAFAFPDGRVVVACRRDATANGTTEIVAALEKHADRVSAPTWMRYGIDAGVPMLSPATTDAFVAQNLNWDLLGGINFQKGCYPGQEIVARTQYLGRPKERLFGFHTGERPVAVGTKLFSATFDSSQACGVVVNAAPDSSTGSVLLAVTQLAAAAAGDVALGSAEGPRLTARPLPYEIPATSAPRDRRRPA